MFRMTIMMMMMMICMICISKMYDMYESTLIMLEMGRGYQGPGPKLAASRSRS